MRSTLLFLFVVFSLFSCKPGADVILHHGKIITVDNKFSIAQAIAIKDGKIIALGSDQEVLDYKRNNTKIIDLANKTVIPGLIDEHVHPVSASQSELADTIPDVHTINQLLSWIKQQTQIKQDGGWIIHPKFFITRMLDMRQLTLRELDSVAPNHPVFLNGSFGGMVNTRALEVSNLLASPPAGILKSPQTNKPTGFIHSSAFKLLAIPPTKALTEEQRINTLQNMFRNYNKMGITSICSGGGDTTEYALYQQLHDNHTLSVRIFHNFIFPFASPVNNEDINTAMNNIGKKTGDGDDMLRVGAFKLVLDGGVLTGTAFMREPWGSNAEKVYGITDTLYRGNIFYSEKDLVQIIRQALAKGWKFSAHVTGGGGVDTLLAAYEKVNDSVSIRNKRFSIIHGNFFAPEAIRKMSAMNIYADMQPAWYLKDADLLYQVLGSERLSSFHPYRTMIDNGIVINGGSDHMVKLDPNASVNPYNPFLAIWSLVTRKTERGTVFSKEQAISREEALRLYTINNAMASFEENRKGSLEKGKYADMAVLSSDILTCPVDSIKTIHSTLTMVNGKVVYEQ